MDAADEFGRAVDLLIEKYADDCDYVDVEMILQQRAQDMRELAYQSGDRVVIQSDELDGWTD